MGKFCTIPYVKLLEVGKTNFHFFYFQGGMYEKNKCKGTGLACW